MIIIFLVGCQTQPEIAEEPQQTSESGGGEVAVEVTESVKEPEVKEETAVKQIQVTAKRFEFIPNLITVNKGDKVRLLITSIDVEHGFKIKTPFVNVNKQLPPNQEVVVEFTATEAGEYDFVCSVVCGSGHSGMNGKLVVK